jgi:hypothetical protein
LEVLLQRPWIYQPDYRRKQGIQHEHLCLILNEPTIADDVPQYQDVNDVAQDGCVQEEGDAQLLRVTYVEFSLI